MLTQNPDQILSMKCSFFAELLKWDGNLEFKQNADKKIAEYCTVVRILLVPALFAVAVLGHG